MQTQPGGEPGFWYPIDRDIAHQGGRVLAGPGFAELTARLPYPVLLPVVIESIAAHRDGVVEHGDNAVLNGCRALRFHGERTWSAKPVAARWALRQAPGFQSVIAAALDSHRRDRAHGRIVDTETARSFLGYVLHRMRHQGAAGTG